MTRTSSILAAWVIAINTTHYLAEREEDSFLRHCRLARRLAPESQHIVDVGANIGQSVSRYRAEFPNCNITAFEPNPEIFSQLERNWGTAAGIKLYTIALTNSIGQATFFSTRVSEVSSLLQPTRRMSELSSERKYDYKTVNVPTATLDHCSQEWGIGRIDILKVDVQGSELSVLQGAEKLLQEGKIAVVYTEITFAEMYVNQTDFIDLLAYLQRFRYELWDLCPFLYTRNDRVWAANATFVHASAASLLESRQASNAEVEHDAI